MKQKFKFLILGAVVSLLLTLNSCEKEKFFPIAENPVEELANIMDYWYFWNDSLPNINIADYSDPRVLLEALRYGPRDKWSYISTKQEESQYYDEGTYIGHGFGYAVDNDGRVRISFVFQSSDLVNAGITRGWIINKINGISVDENTIVGNLLGASSEGVSNDFEFESPSGEILTIAFTKKLITINTVLYSNIITVGAKKIGYLVFESFINPSKSELDIVFNNFKSVGVSDLIIDLRYNGGGLMDIASHLAGWIIPDRLNDELFLKYIHNNDRSSQNGNLNFKINSNSLRLEKVYFITTNRSASASEAIINGLKPYIETYIVGDDSYGKPVGMYSFRSNLSDYVYVPISFKIVNSDGYGDYYDGLTADAYASDDIKHDFGDMLESSFAEALYHIENGSFSGNKSKENIKRSPKKVIRTIKDELDAY